MNEEISSLVDGELQGPLLDRQFARLKNEPEVRAAWDTYVLIGDAMRGHVAPDICARVVSKLAEEPTVLAPRTRFPERKTIATWGMSLAAGAAAAALVIWTVLPVTQEEIQFAQKAAEAQMPMPQTPSSVDVADYLLAHQRYSATSAMQGVAPYVRAVADEHRTNR